MRWPTLALFLSLPAGAWSEDEIDFGRDVRPILSSRCFSCHGPDDSHREAGLRLDERSHALAKLESGSLAIVAGRPEASELIARVTSEDESLRMPPAGKDKPLSKSEIETLGRWIASGAGYSPHWSFAAPRRPTLPLVMGDWAESALDLFALEGMWAHGLSPSPRAERWLWARRASLDVCGLPTTPSESARFVEDASADAHERLLDRLLASPAYGERWARVWLDLARYADSSGYASDPLRMTMWRYREWVIDAFNENMPFDRFTLEQMAGDLLPSARPETVLATAFHRNTMTNTEGGTDDEEWRVAAVKDRVSTTMQVWMGLTVGCAQCHNHKYDPITQKEFYSLYAIFNQTEDADRPDEEPTLGVLTRSMQDERVRIEGEIDGRRAILETPTEDLARDQLAWESSLELPSQWQPLERLTSSRSADDRMPTVEGTVEGSELTGLRLESSGQTLPADFRGELAAIEVTIADAASMDRPVLGRIVRIDLPGPQRILSLAEVEVFSAGANVAADASAKQSSVAFDGEARRAVDGNTDGEYYRSNSVTHTNTEADPWWEIDLGRDVPVDRVQIWNRADGLSDRLAGAIVRVMDEHRRTLSSMHLESAPLAMTGMAIEPWQRLQIRSVVVSSDGDPVGTTSWLTFAEATPVADRTQVRIRLREPTLGEWRWSATSDARMLARSKVPAEVIAMIDRPTEKRSADEQSRLATHYRSVAPRLQSVRDEIAALEKSKPIGPKVPVLRPLASNDRRKTLLMVKGNFLTPGDEVSMGLPAFLPGSRAPEMTREALASWLVDRANPLTARVTVNRYWSRLMGRGIVETEEDFGTQGDLPSHPELLDLLAVDFAEGGWDMKGLVRQIMTSATYQQTSRVTPDRLEKDPANRWWSRAPRDRLDAESVRDQALAISGLLSAKIGGPSVYPYQPAGLWQAAFNSDRTWATSAGEDRYRRGLYTFWRRTIPYPSMATFDAPSREICTLRRPKTNTPLQALVTMNDPAYVEMAQALGRRIAREAGYDAEARVRYGLSIALARPIDEASVSALVRMLVEQRELYRRDLAGALELSTNPIGPLPAGMEPSDGAALTVLGNVLLNLDGVLTKG